MTPTSLPEATLAALPVGAHGVVDHLVGRDEPIGARLASLGFLPGTEVRVVRRAPLGDPTIYELRGTRLCLRSTEARRVVLLVEGTGS
ncbi:MAG: FeoA family protein [Ilumatobacteraceae bacterium]